MVVRWSYTPDVPIIRIELAERGAGTTLGRCDCVCLKRSVIQRMSRRMKRLSLMVLVVANIDIGRVSVPQVRSMLVIPVSVVGGCFRH